MGEQYAAARKVLEQLEKAGFEAYFVGGCVRDQLLGKEPADYDVTTNALPSEVQQLFTHTIPTGLQHGTVTVMQDTSVIEVTTYRVERIYQDHRRPSEVNFVSQLKEDLLRRDFTINAMAMDLRGEIIDYADGQKDLAAKIIRTVGSAEERFKEDALRMLRACRFAAQLSFQIDPVTLEAIIQCREFASYLAVERVIAEFTKIWNVEHSSIGLRPLIETRLLESLSPFCFLPITPKFWEESWYRLDSIPSEIAKWAYFFHFIFCQDDKCKQVCSKDLISQLPKFKFSNQMKKSIANILTIAGNWNPQMSGEQGKSLLLYYQLETIYAGEALWNLITEQEEKVPLLEWWKQMPIHQFAQLAIKGSDLLGVTGMPAGPWLKETLHYLYHQVAYGRIPNDLKVLEREGERYGASLTS
jgi:tRNA nucleotidyltransferase (CCA-adding enzyme)